MTKGARDSGATRAQQWRNQSRAVHQVVRLLSAGARIDELSLGDVLELLQIRGDRREGLSRATYYRWRQQAERGTLSTDALEEWLKVHEPYALGFARLTRLPSVEGSYDLPMRLWVGVAPSNCDVVLAELKVLQAAHIRGGRPDAAGRTGEFMAFVEEMSSGGRTLSTSRLPSLAAFLASHARDSTEVFDGVWIGVSGTEAAARTTFYRADTEAYSLALDGESGEPFTADWALSHLRNEPSTSDRANLITTAAGRAALIERALLVQETSTDKNALAATARLLRELLPHLDYPEGFKGQRDEHGSSWSVFHWEALCLRARAWAHANSVEMPVAVWRHKSDSSELSRRRQTLATLRPSTLRELTEIELKLPAGSPTPVLDALASDEMKHRAWGISASYRQTWLTVLEDVLAQRRTEPAIARTTIRNLRDLERTLRLGVHVDGETKRQLMQAMKLLATQLSMD